MLRSVSARLIAICVAAISLLGLLAERGSAGPFALSAAGAESATLVEKAHGFHCRRRLGWDPVAGVYRYHRHEGICRDYKRCLAKQRRCIFILGRGWQRWSYEAFWPNNSRYTACMIRAGCY